MDKKSYMALIHQMDQIERGKSSGFLNLQEQKTLKQLLDKNHISYQVYSYFGHQDRVIYSKTRPKISLLEIKTDALLTHQMLLGSFFSLQLDSKILGDFIQYENRYYMYVDAKYKDYLLENFRQVGRYSVTLKVAHLHDLDDYQPAFASHILLVSSYRLDHIVSQITGFSRSKVKELFHEEWIRYMDETVLTGSMNVKEGDIFSIKKFGKYQVGAVQGKTKKNRIILEIKKYLFV